MPKCLMLQQLNCSLLSLRASTFLVEFELRSNKESNSGAQSRKIELTERPDKTKIYQTKKPAHKQIKDIFSLEQKDKCFGFVFIEAIDIKIQ